jgi:hypothetical protein
MELRFFRPLISVSSLCFDKKTFSEWLFYQCAVKIHPQAPLWLLAICADKNR